MKNDNLKIVIALLIAFFLSQATSNFFLHPKKYLNSTAFFLKNIKNELTKKNKKIPTPTQTTLTITKKNFDWFEKKLNFPSITPTPIFFPKPTTNQILPTNIPIIKPTKQPTQKLPSPTLSPTLPPQISKKLSASKLGIFGLLNYTPATEKILNAGPRIIKFIDPQYQPHFMEAVKKYKQNYPQGLVILRFWQGTSGLKYSLSNDPIQSANDFFSKVNQPAISSLGDNIFYFDYLQTPNEFENTPEWWGEEKIVWNGKFWRRLTELNKNAGIKTCVGGIPVGNVQAFELGYIIEDLKAMKNLGAAFCYHGYTFHYSTDIDQEIHLSLRYRQFYDFFRNNAPELLSMPLILSESGVAENGDPKAGYLINQNLQKYKDWLIWFDNQLKNDPYVIGTTIFQIGNNTDWGYFNLEPITDWLASYLINN